MNNIKPNIKKQAIVIKHYKGNSIIRSIRCYNFIMKNSIPITSVTNYKIFHCF